MRQDFLITYEDSIESIFQPWQTGYYIRAPREQNAVKFFLLNRKISLCVFSCANLVKSSPNSVNICYTWQKFKILSFYPGKDTMSEKTSHDSVPLRAFVYGTCGPECDVLSPFWLSSSSACVPRPSDAGSRRGRPDTWKQNQIWKTRWQIGQCRGSESARIRNFSRNRIQKKIFRNRAAPDWTLIWSKKLLWKLVKFDDFSTTKLSLKI